VGCSRVNVTFTYCPMISSDIVVTTREEFWVITLLLILRFARPCIY